MTINGIRIWKCGKYRKLDKDKQKCVEEFLRLGILIPIQNVPGGREITVKGNKRECKGEIRYGIKRNSRNDVELKQANNTIFYLIRALKNKDVSKREIDYLCDLGKYNLPISVIMEL